MNTHGIENEKVLFLSESRAVLEFKVPAGSDFFDGHFPEFKLLPAVGQFEIITRFSKKYFDTDRAVPLIRRMKFSSPVLPDSSVHLELDFDAEKKHVSFIMRKAGDENTVYSSGGFSVDW